jgi:homoserine O-succinyltransferase
VDIFTREPPGHSRFVLCQGHPEYDPVTLGREYLHEMDRFLHGKRDERPRVPENYFDRATEDQLMEMDAQPPADPARYGQIVTDALPLKAWHQNTVRLFANWLTLIAATKSRKLASRSVHTRRRAS